MRIAIIGDSWAHRPDQDLPGYTKEGHWVTDLIKAGYLIEDYSLGGSSNWASWRRFRDSDKTNPDWIIWMHTELGRDWRIAVPATRWQMESRLSEIACWVYDQVTMIMRDNPSTKLMVIEGQAPRAEPWFSERIRPDYLIEDWRAQILGERLAVSQIWGCLISDPDFLKDCTNPIQEQIQWVEAAADVLERQRQSPGFPDQCHPGDRESRGMAARLIKILSRP